MVTAFLACHLMPDEPKFRKSLKHAFMYKHMSSTIEFKYVVEFKQFVGSQPSVRRSQSIQNFYVWQINGSLNLIRGNVKI